MGLGGALTSLAEFETFCRSASSDATCQPQPEFTDLATAFEQVIDDPVVVASLARHAQSFRDRRIRGVFAIAPVTRMFTEESLLNLQLPVSIVVGSMDRSAPAATNGRYAADRVPGARFRIVDGAGHYTFLAECTDVGQARLPDLCSDAPGIDRGAIHEAVAADAIRFFNGIFYP